MTQPTANCMAAKVCNADANMEAQFEYLNISPALNQHEQAQSSIHADRDRMDPAVTSFGSASEIEEYSSELLDVRPVPGKGLGVVAVKDIAAGTCLLIEEPVMIIPNPQFTASYLQEIFDDLDPEVQEVIMNLASAHGQDTKNWPCDLTAQLSGGSTIPPPKIHSSVQGLERTKITDQHMARLSPEKSLMSIVMTNAVSLNEGSGIFPILSRFNHSCLPNATYNWQIKMQKETVYATRDIAAGEEILVSYVDAYDLPEKRAWTLKNYGFACQCRACVDDGSGFAAASRHRRWRLGELWDRSCNLIITNEERIADLVEEIALLKEEGVITVALNER